MASNRNFDMIFGAVEQSDGSYIDRDGTITWYTEAGKYHNEDGPAIAFPSGVNTIITTRATRNRIRAYSANPCPSSPLRNLLMILNM